VSAAEDAGSVGLALLAAFHPIVTLAVVLVLMVLAVLLMRKLSGAMRKLFRRFLTVFSSRMGVPRGQ
jgi:hypothetical protein